jgi:hypothetical protein
MSDGFRHAAAGFTLFSHAAAMSENTPAVDFAFRPPAATPMPFASRRLDTPATGATPRRRERRSSERYACYAHMLFRTERRTAQSKERPHRSDYVCLAHAHRAAIYAARRMPPE